MADLADVQAPAIYYYFSSREDLIEEVMWSGVAELRKHLEEALDKLPNGTMPLDRFSVAIRRAPAPRTRPVELCDCRHPQRRAGAPGDPGAAGRRGERLRRHLGRHPAGRSVRSEIGSDIDVPTALMLVFGAMNWTGEWWDPELGDVDDLVTTAKVFILNGLTGALKGRCRGAWNRAKRA